MRGVVLRLGNFNQTFKSFLTFCVTDGLEVNYLHPPLSGGELDSSKFNCFISETFSY
jgi:hypothetical protein